VGYPIVQPMVHPRTSDIPTWGGAQHYVASSTPTSFVLAPGVPSMTNLNNLFGWNPLLS